MKQVEILWKLVEQDDYPLTSIGWDANGKFAVITVQNVNAWLASMIGSHNSFLLFPNIITFYLFDISQCLYANGRESVVVGT